jgi:hypothetical protein
MGKKTSFIVEGMVYRENFNSIEWIVYTIACNISTVLRLKSKPNLQS